MVRGARRSVRQHPGGLPRRAAGHQDGAGGEEDELAAAGAVGAARARVAAVHQGRPAHLPQGPVARVRVAVLHQVRLEADRGAQRLQDDQGRLQEGGVHGPPDDGVHEHTRRLR